MRVAFVLVPGTLETLEEEEGKGREEGKGVRREVEEEDDATTEDDDEENVSEVEDEGEGVSDVEENGGNTLENEEDVNDGVGDAEVEDDDDVNTPEVDEEDGKMPVVDEGDGRSSVIEDNNHEGVGNALDHDVDGVNTSDVDKDASEVKVLVLVLLEVERVRLNHGVRDDTLRVEFATELDEMITLLDDSGVGVGLGVGVNEVPELSVVDSEMLQLQLHVPLADEDVKSLVLEGRIGVTVDDSVGEGLQLRIVEL